jgi:hypothetical protein
MSVKSDVLSLLKENRAIDLQVVYEFFEEGGVSKDTVARTLRRLRQEGSLQIIQRGSARIAMTSDVTHWKHQLDHYVEFIRILSRLRKTVPEIRFFSNDATEKPYILTYGKGAQLKSLIPDGFCDTASGKFGLLEYETMIKSERRYTEIFETYSLQEEVDFVVYLCSDIFVLKKMQRIFAETISPSPYMDSPKFFFVDTSLEGTTPPLHTYQKLSWSTSLWGGLWK